MKSERMVKIVFLWILFVPAVLLTQDTFIEDAENGTMTIQVEGINVLTYCFGDQLKQGVDPKFTRSCYIHPLYSMDGAELTHDFPKDHFHHRGLFWTWPIVNTRGKNTQTWHVQYSSLRQYFVRWLKQSVENNTAILSVENTWKLDGKEIVAREIVTIWIHPSDEFGRAIDLELKIEAIGAPLELQGALDQNKGYGGLCLRTTPMFTGAAMTTEKGNLEKDSTNVPYRWADLSTEKIGIAVFVSPDHPGFPTTWLIRNGYAGILNPSWPGLELAVLDPGKPATLKYRIYIHRGDAASGQVQRAYELYIASFSQ